MFIKCSKKVDLIMTFHTEWVNEPYIMETIYEGRVSGNDLQMSMLEHLGAVQEQDLYILLDFSDADRVPPSLLELPALSQVVGHGNMRWLAIVNPEGDTDSYTAHLMVNDKVKIFLNRESAVAFLRGMVRTDTGDVLDASAS
jgi:hypothetical protein